MACDAKRAMGRGDTSDTLDEARHLLLNRLLNRLLRGRPCPGLELAIIDCRVGNRQIDERCRDLSFLPAHGKLRAEGCGLASHLFMHDEKPQTIQSTDPQEHKILTAP